MKFLLLNVSNDFCASIHESMSQCSLEMGVYV